MSSWFATETTTTGSELLRKRVGDLRISEWEIDVAAWHSLLLSQRRVRLKDLHR